jgi:hypothetical protein
MNLKGRIERLEAVEAPTVIPELFVRFGPGQDSAALNSIKCGDRTWDRLPDESVEAFENRARAEAPPPRPGCARVFLCGSGDNPMFHTQEIQNG